MTVSEQMADALSLLVSARTALHNVVEELEMVTVPIG